VQLNLILSREAVSVGGTSKTLKFLGEIGSYSDHIGGFGEFPLLHQ
jgi:hypothetical protein